MKWEEPTSETNAKFEPLIRLLANLNSLANYDDSLDELSWRFANGKLYVDGDPANMVTLYSVIWHITKDYACCYKQIDGDILLEVRFIY